MLWTVKGTPHFKKYLPIEEFSQEWYAWVYVDIKQKESKLPNTTDPHLPIQILGIKLG